MVKTRQLLVVGCLFALALGASVSAVEVPRVSAALAASRVAVQNGIADVTFKVVVRNEDAVALSNVWVVFEDGFQIAVSDVPAEGAAESAETSRSFDISESPSKNTPFPVTLKYAVDGQNVEQPASVVLSIEQ